MNTQSIQANIIYDIIDILTYAGIATSAAYEHFRGKECLDVHLLKPARLDVIPGQPDVVCADDVQQGPALLEYPFCKSHPILRWLRDLAEISLV